MCVYIYIPTMCTQWTVFICEIEFGLTNGKIKLKIWRESVIFAMPITNADGEQNKVYICTLYCYSVRLNMSFKSRWLIILYNAIRTIYWQWNTMRKMLSPVSEIQSKPFVNGCCEYSRTFIYIRHSYMHGLYV